MQVAQVITTKTKATEIMVTRTTAADRIIPWRTVIFPKTITKIIISENGITETGMLTFNGGGIALTNPRVRI